MKKITAILVISAISIAMLSACGKPPCHSHGCGRSCEAAFSKRSEAWIVQR